MKWACVARFGGIGDNLITSSVLPALKKKYDRVEVISQRPQHVVFENNPFVDKLSVYSVGDLPGGDAWQEWFKSRSREYEFFANLSHTCETTLAFVKAQTQFWWPASVRRKLCARSYIEMVADICEVPYEDCAPGFFPTDEDREGALEAKATLGKRCVGWVVSGSRVDKIYPFASVVIARIIRDLGVPVILFGAPGKDQEIAHLIEENLKIQHGGALDGFHVAISGNAENDDTWPIRRSLTQLQMCDLVVGPDTGGMWAVASCDMPKIMLLSHASPENITKHWRNTMTLHAGKRVSCWPCHLLHDDASTCVSNEWNSGAACISDITAIRLFSAISDALLVKRARVSLRGRR
jgi:ADP-heptose:LPS heptosyltransferase